MAAIPPQLIGESPAFHVLMDQISDLASLDRTLLIVGERGTGKELVSSRLHFLSPRWEQEYYTVNCAAFNDDQLDAEIFGEVFSDSRQDRSGRLELVDGGTLFLDNIDAMSPRLQEKLMRVIDYGDYLPINAIDMESTNVRILAATCQDLVSAASRGEFRADLLNRLAFEVLTLPPLRNRKEDIPRLSEQFGQKIAQTLGADSFPGFTPEALAFLMEQEWVGNIRFLKNVVERSVARAFLEDETLSQPLHSVSMDPFASPWRLDDRPAEQTQSPEVTQSQAPEPTEPDTPQSQSFNERVMRFERGLIDEALTVGGNHQGKAADHLGLSYHQFRGLLRKHGLKK